MDEWEIKSFRFLNQYILVDLCAKTFVSIYNLQLGKTVCHRTTITKPRCLKGLGYRMLRSITAVGMKFVATSMLLCCLGFAMVMWSHFQHSLTASYASIQKLAGKVADVAQVLCAPTAPKYVDHCILNQWKFPNIL